MSVPPVSSMLIKIKTNSSKNTFKSFSKFLKSFPAGVGWILIYSARKAHDPPLGQLNNYIIFTFRCGAQFRHDSTLTMHIRTRHDHLKPFTCDGCSKKFGRMSHLRKHQRNVCGRSGLRGAIAQCKYCDATFTKKVDLKGHFNVCEKKPDRVDKDGLNPSQYPCETCGKEFSRVYDFKRHQLSHSDEKPYGCPQCGKTFKERSSLNKHVKRMHCSDGDGTIPIDDDGICGGTY